MSVAPANRGKSTVPAHWLPEQRALEDWKRQLEQQELNFLLPFEDEFSAKSAAKHLRIGKTSVHEMCEQGYLEWRPVNITGTRGDKRITRRSILRFIAAHWQLPPREFEMLVVELVDRLGSIPMWQAVRDRCSVLIAKQEFARDLGTKKGVRVL